MTAARVVFDEWVCRFGFPVTIQSDQGRHFAVAVFEDMCMMSGITHKMESVGNAQSQGQVERQKQLMNQTKAPCNNNIDSWPTAIHITQHALNVSINETTGTSPHEMMYGQVPRTPEAVALLEDETVEEELAKINTLEGDRMKLDTNRDTKNRLKDLLTNVCRENILTQRKVQQKQDSRAVSYKVGDRVRVRLNDVQKNKLGGKRLLQGTQNHTL